MQEINLTSVINAQRTLKGIIKRTPLNHSATFSKMIGCEVYCKYENLQKAGSFKIRGAYNKIANLKEHNRKKGVIAVSTGNHAQGVALAATLHQIPATIVMPKGAPIPKIQATKDYGGEIVIHGEGFEEAYNKAKELERSRDLTLIHAFDDPFVVAGQGTIGLEILEDLPEVDVILCPIGGGGLISGIATVIKAKNPNTRIIGVQTKKMDSTYRSFKAGSLISTERGYTIADGIAIKSPSAFTFSMIKALVDDIVVVDEEEIARAILLLLERCKAAVEGAGAVSLAALLHRNVVHHGDKVVLILSGGNIDITMVSKIITQGLIKAGRYAEAHVLIEDKSDLLVNLLGIIAELEVNIIKIDFDRNSPRIPYNFVVVKLALETKSFEHSISCLNEIKKHYTLYE
ncbi:MAG: threonine ammonia-lyase [Candidatus Hodarchaeota archaeon]